MTAAIGAPPSMSGAKPKAVDDPVRSARPRISGIDLARGIAVIGMMAVHIFPDAENGDPTLAWTLFSGRSSALFALLAGISLTFVTGGTTRPTGATRWRSAAISVATRAALVVVIGLALGVVSDDIAVILVYYGAMFALCIPLLGLRPRTLVAIGALVTMVAPIIIDRLGPSLPATLDGDPVPSDILTGPLRLIADVLVVGTYPAIAWVSYLCFGLAAGRLLSTRTPRFAARLLIGGTVLALAARFTSDWLLGLIGGAQGLADRTPGVGEGEAEGILALGFQDALPTESWWWLAIRAPHTSTPLDLLNTTGVALAVLGFCLLLLRRDRPWLQPLITAGSMPLTMYSLHVLAYALTSQYLDPWADMVLQVVVLLSVASILKSTLGQGPLEMGMSAIAKKVRRATERPQSTRPAQMWVEAPTGSSVRAPG